MHRSASSIVSRQFGSTTAVPLYVPALDGLRGLAASMVVVSHVSNITGLWDTMLGGGGGQVGVMVFFVLSGYLMGGLYLDRPLTTATALAYAMQRVGRIVPLYYAVVLAAVVFGIYPIVGIQQGLAHFGFLAGKSVLWTIPVEVQFYVVFVGLWWLYRRMPRTTIGLCLMLSVAYWVLPIHPRFEMRVFPYYAVFFFGGLLISRAIGLGHHVRSSGWLWALAPLAALPFLLYPNIYSALFGADAWMARGESQEMWHDPRYAIAAVALLLSARLSPPIVWLLASAPMRFLGTISFSMYLLHQPIIELLAARTTLRDRPVMFLVITLALTLASASATFMLIERPGGRYLGALGHRRAAHAA